MYKCVYIYICKLCVYKYKYILGVYIYIYVNDVDVCIYIYMYTGSFYRGSQDGKTCRSRFTWKSFTSNSWGKSETGLPGKQMQNN